FGLLRRAVIDIATGDIGVEISSLSIARGDLAAHLKDLFGNLWLVDALIASTKILHGMRDFFDIQRRLEEVSGNAILLLGKIATAQVKQHLGIVEIFAQSLHENGRRLVKVTSLHLELCVPQVHIPHPYSVIRLERSPRRLRTGGLSSNSVKRCRQACR